MPYLRVRDWLDAYLQAIASALQLLIDVGARRLRQAFNREGVVHLDMGPSLKLRTVTWLHLPDDTRYRVAFLDNLIRGAYALELTLLYQSIADMMNFTTSWMCE
eukprot:3969083-Amphidinium_carterae.2